MNKYLMLGLAGLAFAACSNEEDAIDNGNPTIDGNAAVSIRIVSPAMTKAVEDGTGNVGTVKVTGTMTITVNHSGQPLTKTVVIDENSPAQSTVTFWNVQSPTSVEATINGGISDYSTVAISETNPNMQALPASIPVYGVATPTPTNDVSIGVDADDANNEGANEDGNDPDRTFQMYTATVDLTIPVARLEVSGIQHVEHLSGDQCDYTNLKIESVYLDNVRLKGGDTSTTNLKDPNDTNPGAGSEDDAPACFVDAITPAADFVAPTKWPTTDGEVFGYNFYMPASGATVADNPYFKVRLTYDGASAGERDTRYAMITKYQDEDGADVVMKNGHIYKVTAVAIDDDHIIPGEDGEDLYGVTVTVNEAKWTVETVTGIWAD